MFIQIIVELAKLLNSINNFISLIIYVFNNF